MIAVEVGDSSVQAVYLDSSTEGGIVSLAAHPDMLWLLAAPGLVKGDRVRDAHHLGWMDVKESEELAMTHAPLLSMNDAEAAALGEWVLRGYPTDTILNVSLGTGVGAVVVCEGDNIPVESGLLTAFGPKRCWGCGRVGCLDAQIEEHALPTPLGSDNIEYVVSVLQ